MRLAKKVLTESKTLKPTWTFESSPLIAIKILYLKSLPNNDSRYNSGEILLCTDYIYRTLHSIEETSNLIYINENVIDNKKKEKWFKEKYFWKIILYYNTILVTLFWFFLSPFILFIFSINAI